MLEPEDAAELDRIRDAKQQAREIAEWERRVVLRARRNGATQEEIGRRLGISQQAVFKIEQRDG